MFTLNLNHSFAWNRKTQLEQQSTGITWLKSRSHARCHRFCPRISNAFQSPAVADCTSQRSVEQVDKFEELISCIKKKLNTIEDGRISVSPYNTAWIALIKNMDGHDHPEFPSSLRWIAENQLSDGSWGDQDHFNVFDRLVNTIACVIALKLWNVHSNKIEQGVWYVKQNMWRVEVAKQEHMTCGFEVIFPSLLRRASELGIRDFPYDSPFLSKIHAIRDQKLKKIPRELMHETTTTLLYSLEALEDLDWERLMKLQSADGSFFTSPSATAFAFMQTQDLNCLKFISNIVEKFHGGAPHTYPVHFFARLWAVDRLQRLGISRFFQSEIEDCLSYVYRFWNEKGIFSARDINFSDVDDTSMAFRLLRMQGYNVNPNVLRNFMDGGGFYCHSRELTDSTTPTFALLRASQLRYPGEDILEEAYNFSYNSLRGWLAGDQPFDKWIVTDNLSHEIKIGLEIPWYASLPRVEAAYYLQHYGGSTDVWIAKTLYRYTKDSIYNTLSARNSNQLRNFGVYALGKNRVFPARMPDITNDEYLELARLDFRRCQAQHRIEWSYMQSWYENLEAEKYGISRKDLLVAYFLSAASLFEPERAKQRIVWAKIQLISRMIKTHFNSENKKDICPKKLNILLEAVHEGYDECISHQLKEVWGLWLRKLNEGDSWGDAELFVTTLNICSNHFLHNHDIMFHQDYMTLSNLVNKVCCHLSQIPNKKVEENRRVSSSINVIEKDLQALTKLVLEEWSIINTNIKQTFMLVAKAFYYRAYFHTDTIDLHIFKVLFNPIV